MARGCLAANGPDNFADAFFAALFFDLLLVATMTRASECVGFQLTTGN